MIKTSYMQKFFAVLWVTVFITFIGIQHLQAQENPIKELRQRFQSGKVFHAGFSHIYKDAYTNQSQKSSGEVWVGDAEYKVTSKNQKVLVYNGLSRVYDENRNRVVISKYEPQEDDFAPSKFLTATDTLYNVESQVVQQDTVRVTLKSGDPFAVFKQIKIILDQSLNPIRIEAVDQADNQVITKFNAGKFMDEQKSMFELNYPQDAKIIDLRE